jgi:hypothetical protein
VASAAAFTADRLSREHLERLARLPWTPAMNELLFAFRDAPAHDRVPPEPADEAMRRAGRGDRRSTRTGRLAPDPLRPRPLAPRRPARRRADDHRPRKRRMLRLHGRFADSPSNRDRHSAREILDRHVGKRFGQGRSDRRPLRLDRRGRTVSPTGSLDGSSGVRPREATCPTGARCAPERPGASGSRTAEPCARRGVRSIR